MGKSPDTISFPPLTEQYDGTPADAIRTPAGLPAEILGTSVVLAATEVEGGHSTISALDSEV